MLNTSPASRTSQNLDLYDPFDGPKNRYECYAEQVMFDGCCRGYEGIPLHENEWMGPPANENAALRIGVTFFPNKKAQSKRVSTLTLAELGDLILKTSAKSKDKLPWLKFATFGNKRTDKNCLRHNANVLSISGIEADYDAKRITFDKAVAVANRAGLAALLYTSASYTDAAPKWRMLLPTSQPLPPGERAKLVARVNGLYGGVFAPESFTLSQSYYFGSVNNNPAHRVRVLKGDCIDRRRDLDAGAIGGNNVSAPHSEDKQADPDLVAAALAVIPNDDTPDTHAYWEKIGIRPDDRASRDYWVKVGMATKAAAGDEGAFDTWSQKWPGYNAEKTTTFWASAHPREIGAGTLFWLANEACPGWREAYNERVMADLASLLREQKSAPPSKKLPLIVELGSKLWGMAVVSGKEYRIGADQSKVIDPGKGAWFDFTTNKGGYLKDLMKKVEIASREQSNVDDVVTVRAADVAIRPLDWIWPGHLLRGSQELMSGLPDLCKSQVQICYIACATARLPWPDGAPAIDPMNVVMLTAEDTVDQILVPRLRAAGADISRVHVLKCIKTDEHDRQFYLAEDLYRLEHTVKKIGDVGLITLDPITAYMGGKMDSNKATEVRSQLGPLKDFAERLNIAISTITHPAKSAGQRALDHFIASQAFIAACRIGHLCVAEMEVNEDGECTPTGRILFTTVRHSYSKPVPTLAYHKEVVTIEQSIELGLIEAPRVIWEGVVEITADAAVAAASGRKPDLQPKVQAFLREMLKDGRMVPQKEVEEAAAINSFTNKQLRTAREKLGVHTIKEKGKMGGDWLWCLGSPTNRRPVRL